MMSVESSTFDDLPVVPIGVTCEIHVPEDMPVATAGVAGMMDESALKADMAGMEAMDGRIDGL
jgi:hypothetical protein